MVDHVVRGLTSWGAARIVAGPTARKRHRAAEREKVVEGIVD